MMYWAETGQTVFSRRSTLTFLCKNGFLNRFSRARPVFYADVPEFPWGGAHKPTAFFEFALAREWANPKNGFRRADAASVRACAWDGGPRNQSGSAASWLPSRSE